MLEGHEENVLTGITRWRPAGARVRHHHLPLPEPPRTHHVSKASRRPKDRLARAMEEWLKDQSVVTTYDAD